MITKKEATELHDRCEEALKVLQSIQGGNILNVQKIALALQEKIDEVDQLLCAYTADVGDSVTYGIMTDMYPYTVISVSRGGKELGVQADSITTRQEPVTYPIGGTNPNRTVHEFSRNRQGHIKIITLRSDGQYREKGQDTRSSIGSYWIIGERKHHINRDN